jgi:hypothetical protein
MKKRCGRYRSEGGEKFVYYVTKLPNQRHGVRYAKDIKSGGDKS